MAEGTEKKKSCFLICPIGEDKSDIRHRSDQVYKHIVKPAVEPCGYKITRADKISEPGIITSQIVQHLLDDDLVVADLSGRNANVFYELAVRHMTRKPVVLLIQAGEAIPLDVAQNRAIAYDLHDLDAVESCKDDIGKQIRSLENDKSTVQSPISVAIDLHPSAKGGEREGKVTAEMLSLLQEVRFMVGRLQPGGRAVSPEWRYMVHRLLRVSMDAANHAKLGEGKQPSEEWLNALRLHVYRLVEMIQELAIHSGDYTFLPRSLTRRRPSSPHAKDEPLTTS